MRARRRQGMVGSGEREDGEKEGQEGKERNIAMSLLETEQLPWEPVTTDESAAMNAWAAGLGSGEEEIIPDSGKVIAYVGWFWRTVDFTQPFTVYIPPEFARGHEDVPTWVGFMENNKWGYSERVVTQDEYKAIVAALRVARADTTRENLIKVFDAMQTCGKR